MNFNTNMEKTESYTDVREQTRLEKIKEEHKKGKKVLRIALDYYTLNYPKSQKGIKYSSNKDSLIIDDQKELSEILEELTENQLYSIFEIFDYYSKEIGFSNTRRYESKRIVLGLVKKLIPGGDYIEKIRKLSDELSDKEEILMKYKKQLEDDRIAFNKRLNEVRKKEEEKRKLESENKEDLFICEICKKECKSLAGLSSHMRSHENNVENIEKI